MEIGNDFHTNLRRHMDIYVLLFQHVKDITVHECSSATEYHTLSTHHCLHLTFGLHRQLVLAWLGTITVYIYTYVCELGL